MERLLWYAGGEILKSARVWPLNVFAPWPRINYTRRARLNVCLLAQKIVQWRFLARGCCAERSLAAAAHKRKDLAAGVERASSKLSRDYLSSRMDARMDHVGYVTRKKKTATPPVPFAPIINLIINCMCCLRAWYDLSIRRSSRQSCPTIHCLFANSMAILKLNILPIFFVEAPIFIRF